MGIVVRFVRIFVSVVAKLLFLSLRMGKAIRIVIVVKIGVISILFTGHLIIILRIIVIKVATFLFVQVILELFFIVLAVLSPLFLKTALQI